MEIDLSNVEFIDQTDNIKEIYSKTQILIFPSIFESYGRVAVEACINGIPVIASDLPGIREATYNLSYYVSDTVLGNYSKYKEGTKEVERLYVQDQKESIKLLLGKLSLN
mgnify:CR=1 FL=1